MPSSSRPGSNTARRRRAQALRSQARHVLWLSGLLQSAGSHHTHQTTAESPGELRRQICALEKEVAGLREVLRTYINARNSEVMYGQGLSSSSPPQQRGGNSEGMPSSQGRGVQGSQDAAMSSTPERYAVPGGPAVPFGCAPPCPSFTSCVPMNPERLAMHIVEQVHALRVHGAKRACRHCGRRDGA